MNRRQTLAVLFAGLVVVPAAGTVAIGTVGAESVSSDSIVKPDVTVFAPDNELTPGKPTALTLQVQNDARIISGGANPTTEQKLTTARGVEVTLKSDGAPIDVNTATQPAGSLPEGALRPVTFEVVAGDDIKPGTYDMEAEIEYDYYRTVTADGLYASESKSTTVDVTVRVTDDARFEVVGVSDDVAVGETGDVALTVRNVGGETASEARISVQSGSPDIGFGQSPSATRYLGDVKQNEERTVRIEPTATRGASASAYPLTATVSFQDRNGVASQSAPLQFGVQLGAEQSVSIENVTSLLAVGDRGTITATLTNEGPRTIRDATVALQPKGQTVVPVEPNQPLGTLAPGESTTVRYPVRATGEAEPGPRQLSFVVDYQQNGEAGRSEPVFVRIELADEQTFSLSEINSTLRVGAEGGFEFTLTNDGPNAVSDAVVVLQPAGQNVQPQETEYAVGDLAVGENTTVTFPVDVTSSAAPIAKQLSATVEYRNTDGDLRQSDPISSRVDVAPEQPVFALEGVSTQLEAGSEGTVELRLTNNRDEELTNINAKLFVDSPLSVSTDEAYVPSLAPGNSTTIAFDLSVDGDALARNQPVELDFQYDEPDGDTKLTNTYQLPVDVTASSGGGPGLATIAVGLLAIVGVGFGVAYTRR